MSWNTWLLFLAVIIPLCGTPGPNMLHVMTRGASVGPRRAFYAMTGCLAAVILVFAASAGGLAALFLASPIIFEILRWVGVGYLIFIGIKTWRLAGSPIDLEFNNFERTRSPQRLFSNGLTIGLSNPKLILFAAAFLPQFVEKELPQTPQYFILIVTYSVVETSWYIIYAAGGHQLARHFNRPRLKLIFDRAVGGLFILFGAALMRS